MQNDPQNTNGSNTIGQSTNNVAVSSPLDDKVIESSKAILDGMPSPQMSRQPIPVRQPDQQLPAPSSPASSENSLKSNNLVKNALVFGVLLIAILGGFAFFKNATSGYDTKSLNNSGYTYAFTFYKAADNVTLSDGSSADSYQDRVSAKGQPVSGAIVTSCSKYDGNWKQAFTVQLGGKQYPVCTSNDENYAVYFSSYNHNQLFMLTYNAPQPSSINPTLKTIFNSIHVS